MSCSACSIKQSWLADPGISLHYLMLIRLTGNKYARVSFSMVDWNPLDDASYIQFEQGPVATIKIQNCEIRCTAALFRALIGFYFLPEAAIFPNLSADRQIELRR
jgi:hypothetical protein